MWESLVLVMVVMAVMSTNDTKPLCQGQLTQRREAHAEVFHLLDSSVCQRGEAGSLQ